MFALPCLDSSLVSRYHLKTLHRDSVTAAPNMLNRVRRRIRPSQQNQYQTSTRSLSRLSNTRASSISTPINRQSKSLLFRLPLELRTQAYVFVLGGHTFHIYNPRHKDHWVWCFQDHAWKPYSNSFGDCHVCHQLPVKMARLLGLVKSRRKAYIEAIHIVYEQNTFAFMGVDSLTDFRLSYATPKILVGPNPPRIRRLKFVCTSIYFVSELDMNSVLDGVQVLDLDLYRLAVYQDCNLEDYKCLIDMLKRYGGKDAIIRYRDITKNGVPLKILNIERPAGTETK